MFEEITQIIGKTAAAKLQAAFAGREIYIPARDHAAFDARNKRIAALYRRKRGGWTIRQLMDEFDLSERQIWNILKGTP